MRVNRGIIARREGAFGPSAALQPARAAALACRYGSNQHIGPRLRLQRKAHCARQLQVQPAAQQGFGPGIDHVPEHQHGIACQGPALGRRRGPTIERHHLAAFGHLQLHPRVILHEQGIETAFMVFQHGIAGSRQVDEAGVDGVERVDTLGRGGRNGVVAAAEIFHHDVMGGVDAEGGKGVDRQLRLAHAGQFGHLAGGVQLDAVALAVVEGHGLNVGRTEFAQRPKQAGSGVLAARKDDQGFGCLVHDSVEKQSR